MGILQILIDCIGGLLGVVVGADDRAELGFGHAHLRPVLRRLGERGVICRGKFGIARLQRIELAYLCGGRLFRIGAGVIIHQHVESGLPDRIPALGRLRLRVVAESPVSDAGVLQVLQGLIG